MKFLIDAQLPRRLVYKLRDAGHDAVHTLDLPQQNRTPDATIAAIAVRENRVVVTKDADFVNTFLVARLPKKLLLISTGNTTNNELEALLLPNLPAVVAALTEHNFVELTSTTLITHV